MAFKCPDLNDDVSVLYARGSNNVGYGQASFLRFVRCKCGCDVIDNSSVIRGSTGYLPLLVLLPHPSCENHVILALHTFSLGP